jgi:hypothetical protein
MNANTIKKVENLKPCTADDLFVAMRKRQTLVCQPSLNDGRYVEPFPVNINCMEAEDGSGKSWNIDVLILDMQPMVASVYWHESKEPKFFHPQA